MASAQCAKLRCAAKGLSRLTPPPWSQTTRAPLLDFLMPRRSLSSQNHTTQTRFLRYDRHNATAACRNASPSHCRPRPVSPHDATGSCRHRRSLSTTAPRRATHTLFNPQCDEDGNEMKLELTDRAAKRLSEVMAKDGNPYLALRIQVESGGCHGFQYLMSLVTLPEALPPPQSASATPESSVIRPDDTIFVYSTEHPAGLADLTRPKIVLDAPSLDLLKGSKVDFTMELIGSQFKIVDNPLATSSCGCGTSFDINA